MIRKGWLVGGGALILAVGATFGAIQYRDAQVEGDYRKRLEEAWREGLPTNVEQFKTLLPKVDDADNAAKYYVQLKSIPMPKGFDEAKLDRALIFHPTAADEAMAKAGIAAGARNIRFVETASKLSGCRFDRNWKNGFAVLLPEFAQMKATAKLMVLRGSLAAGSDPQAAIRETRIIRRMADHARQEPLEISQLVSASLDMIALRALARWAFKYPQHRAYLREIEAVVASMKDPDLKKNHAFELVEILTLVELSQTPEGLAELGLKDDDIKGMAPAITILPAIQPPRVGRERVLKGMRMLWASVNKPLDQMEAAQRAADMELMQGLMSFPFAAKLYGMFDGGVYYDATSVKSVRAHRITYTAFVRAMADGKPAKSIKTSDLISPFDGRPIDYRFDGKQMTIDARTDGSPLRIPPSP